MAIVVVRSLTGRGVAAETMIIPSDKGVRMDESQLPKNWTQLVSDGLIKVVPLLDSPAPVAEEPKVADEKPAEPEVKVEESSEDEKPSEDSSSDLKEEAEDSEEKPKPKRKRRSRKKKEETDESDSD